MNWTGGARARTNKASTGILHKQKEYFAKIRAQKNQQAYQGSSSSIANGGDEGENGPSTHGILKKSRKRHIPEFDIVVGNENPEGPGQGEEELTRGPPRKKHMASQTALKHVETTKKATRKNQSDAEKKKARDKVRKDLLSTNDWLCTSVSAPLTLKPANPRHLFEASRCLPALTRSIQTFKNPLPALEITRPPPSSKRNFAPLAASPAFMRVSQLITDDGSEFQRHPDTGFNAFKPLSQDGYVRIGKGGLPGNTTEETSQDSFLLDLDDEENESWRKSSPEFVPLMSPSLPNNTDTPINDGHQNRRNRQSSGTRQNILLSDPFIDDIPFELSDLSKNLSKDLSKTRHVGGHALLGRKMHGEFDLVQSSDDVLDSILDQIDETTAIYPLPTPRTFLRGRHTPSSPTSRVSHFVSRVETDTPFVSADLLELHSEVPVTSTQENSDEYELPLPLEGDQSVVARASSSREALSGEEVSEDSEEARWMEFLNCKSKYEYTDEVVTNGHRRATSSDLEILSRDPKFEIPGTNEISDSVENPSSDNFQKDRPQLSGIRTPVLGSDQSKNTSRSKDSNTKWKKFVNGSLKVYPLAESRDDGEANTLVSTALPVQGFLSLEEDENAAWREFVFKGSGMSDSEEDARITIPPITRPLSRNFSPLINPLVSSSTRPISFVSSPYFAGVLSKEGSLAGNASSSSIKKTRAESVMANPSSCSFSE